MSGSPSARERVRHKKSGAVMRLAVRYIAAGLRRAVDQTAGDGLYNSAADPAVDRVRLEMPSRIVANFRTQAPSRL